MILATGTWVAHDPREHLLAPPFWRFMQCPERSVIQFMVNRFLMACMQ
jgi:hypothetical protein